MAIDVKWQLIKNGITQAEVSKELKIHPNTLSNKLDGYTAFTVDEAVRIKEKFLPDVDLRCFSRI